MRIAVVTGNPKPASRTHGVALAVAGALSAALRAPGTPGAAAVPGAHLAVDLAGHASSLFDSSDIELSRLTAEVAAADIAIFASPTYKASYTGMLKAFLDRYGSNGLAGTVAVPVMTGGWAGHSLAVEVHLRPVLVELGATVPPAASTSPSPSSPTWMPRSPDGPPPRSPSSAVCSPFMKQVTYSCRGSRQAGRPGWRRSRRAAPGR